MKRLPPRKPKNQFDKPDHSVRLGGRGPRIGRELEPIQWSEGYRSLMKALRASGRRPNGNRTPRPTPPGRIFKQRVAVRVKYSQQKGDGQWKAHGVYIQRESANEGKFGFDAVRTDVPVSETLHQWQKENDDRLWKIILSPENGNEMNLEEHTRKLMKQMEQDLGVGPLEWTAAVHRNTHKHHVHVALRGKDRTGNPVILDPEYVKRGLRERSENLVTAELGHRFESDIVVSQRLQITQARFTDLDRALLKKQDSEGLTYVNSSNPDLKGLKLATELHCEQRLQKLRCMGLAEQISQHTWRLDPKLEQSLRAMQQTQDRQKIMERFGVLASDPATPFQKTRWRDMKTLEGRILVHGQEDNRAQAYMLFEDVNGKIHYLDHRPEIEQLRKRGKLQAGSYAAMRVVFTGNQPQWIVEDFGPAVEALGSEEFIDRCLRRGVHPPAHGLGGWLGKFREAVMNARTDHEEPEIARERVFRMPGTSPAPEPQPQRSQLRQTPPQKRGLH